MPSRPKNSRTVLGDEAERLGRAEQRAVGRVDAIACVPRGLEERREVVDLERGVVPHRDELVGGALLGAARDVGLAEQREEELLGEQRVDRLRELLAEIVRDAGAVRDARRRFDVAPQEVDLREEVGARERGLEGQGEIAREAVDRAEVIDERLLVAWLTAELRGTAERTLAIEERGRGLQLLDEVLEDLGIGGRCSTDRGERLLDELRFVAIEDAHAGDKGGSYTRQRHARRS
jgi:hypothetical protein